MTNRNRLLRLALALMVGAGAVLAAGPPAADAYAAASGCWAKCPDGSSCTGEPEAGETCTCGCSFWGQKTSVCTCQAIRPSTEA
jgi:hypothetical protein